MQQTQPPMVAVLGTLRSLPPAGGKIPLERFDWTTVEHESASGVVWSTDSLEISGQWNGRALVVDDLSPAGLTDARPTVGARNRVCSDVRMYLETVSIPEFVGWSEHVEEGACFLQVLVVEKNPAVETALREISVAWTAEELLRER